jgi:alginate O-acetyltransferase complex protein AlgI
MNFVSIEYFFFFVPVLAVYWMLRHRAQNLFLVLASFFFYASWNPIMLGLLVFTALVDFLVALRIDKSPSPRARKILIVVSMASNLGVLAYFKYFDFFAQSLADLLSRFGVHPSWHTLHVILPVGISFYTFQSMSYTLDVYFRKLKPSRDFLEFAAFVSCFPQLVAGPIVRAVHFLPQIQAKRTFDWDAAAHGSALFLRGYIKKAFIADTLAMDLVEKIFHSPSSYSGPALLLGALAYAVQIYCDFSGYSDMARGSAALLGFKLPLNFNYPYLAVSLQDFWRRWHISLSTWFRDYVFIPLGGSRGGENATNRNLLVTFVISGLWHGANWTFVVWGALHGIFQVAERRLGLAAPLGAGPARLLAGWLGTQTVVLVGWILFRSPTISQAGTHLVGIVTSAPGLSAPVGGVTMLAFALFLADQLHGLVYPRLSGAFLRLPDFLRGFVYAALIAFLFLLVPKSEQAFIYFQF